MDIVNIVVIIAASIMLVFQFIEVFTNHDFGITDAYINFFVIIAKVIQFIFRAFITVILYPMMLISAALSKRVVRPIQNTQRAARRYSRATREFVYQRASRYER